MNKVLVTGAAGLLGNNLVRLLLQQGMDVTCLEHPAADISVLDGQDVTWVRADLLANDDSLHRAVKGKDAVFHCAAITDLRAPHDLTWAVNFSATKKLVQACLECRTKRLVFTGSASSFAFGDQEAPGNEDSPFPPQYRGLDYMDSKYAAMQYVQQAVAEQKLDAVIVAPTFMLGSNDPRPSSGELIMRFVKQKLRFASPGGRNFANVQDVAVAMINALEKGRSGECYILGGHNVDYLDFFAAVAKTTGMKPPLGRLPGAVIRSVGALASVAEKVSGRPMLVNNTLARLACYQTFYSSAKARSELNMPLTPLQQGIDESVASLLRFGHIQEDDVNRRVKSGVKSGGQT